MRPGPILAVVATLPLLIGLDLDLVGPDPTQYAEVARRLLQSGDLWHLRDQVGPYALKGPLTFWLMAGAMWLFGPTPFAARLPSLIAVVIALIATWRIGRRLWDLRTADLAVALLAATVAIHRMVIDPKVDAVLTATTALSVMFGLEGRMRAFWFFAALGVLVKGPVGLAIPVP
jgi:4-amino-4-deoxy-L-arabinose transferase-like glycosyltransferase